MSSLNVFNKCNSSKDSILKPKNNINLKSIIPNRTNLFHKVNRFEIDKLKKVKPEFKEFFKNLVHNQSYNDYFVENNKVSKSSNKVESYKSKNNKYYNNSFLNNSPFKNKRDILLELDKLKIKIKSKNKNNSNCNSHNKNISCSNKHSNKRTVFKSNDFHNKLLFTTENFGKIKKFEKNSRNYLLNNNTTLFNKITNNNQLNVIISNSSLNNKSHTKNKNKSYEKVSNNKYKGIKNNIINDIKCTKKKTEIEQLVEENNKLKKELEFSQSQVEKYKKYQELYLNLLKKVKSNKTLIKNINSNNQEISKDNYYNSYVNELIDHGKEINKMLNEEEIIEKNIKDLLCNLE